MKLFLVAVLAATPSLLSAQTTTLRIPAGTILPVQLNSSLSSARSKVGDKVSARVMQDVPLANGGKIHARTRITGEVVAVVPATAGAPGRITVRFKTIQLAKDNNLAVTTNLRAIASMSDVDDAQDPKTGSDRGTSEASYSLVQIGGDAVYRGGGHVMHDGEVVGEPLQSGGVLVTPAARPGTSCRGEVAGNTAPQATWVFSSDACGTYGLPNLKIVDAGRNESAGRIVLGANRGDAKVPAGTGMLLRVDSQS